MYLSRLFVSLFSAVIFSQTLLFATDSYSDIYRWTDENGKAHYSDKPPSHSGNSAKTLDKSKAESAFLQQIKTEAGRPTLKSVSNGQFIQYVPRSFKQKMALLVINHGSYDDSTNAEQVALRYVEEWQTFSEETGAILVAPIFDNFRYAVTTEGPQKWGYRGLFGRYVGADEFLHEILDSFQQVNPLYDGKIFLTGHSAGAQFANRYLVRHPQRVHAAAFSAPAWFALPDAELQWPNGMKARYRTVTWPGSRDRQIVKVEPDPASWVQAAQVPTTVVVGSNDLEPQRSEAGVGGDTRIERARYWVEAMDRYAQQHGKPSLVTLQLVDGIGHSSTKLAPHNQSALQPFLREFLR